MEILKLLEFISQFSTRNCVTTKTAKLTFVLLTSVHDIYKDYVTELIHYVFSTGSGNGRCNKYIFVLFNFLLFPFFADRHTEDTETLEVQS